MSSHETSLHVNVDLMLIYSL